MNERTKALRAIFDPGKSNEPEPASPWRKSSETPPQSKALK